MSNEEWWALQREAAQFWRKVKENQTGADGRNGLKHEKVALRLPDSGRCPERPAHSTSEQERERQTLTSKDVA
jgi:hypothetical protein